MCKIFDKNIFLIDNKYIEKRDYKRNLKSVQRRKKCIFLIELQ